MFERVLAAAYDRGSGNLSSARKKYGGIYSDIRKKDYGARDTWIALNDYGKLLAMMQEYSKALEVLTEAKEVARKDTDKNLAESTFHRAFVLDRLGRLDDAVKEYEAARVLSPNNSGILLELGSAYRRTNRFGEAEATYMGLIKLDPKNANAYGNYGNVLITEGKIDEAVQQFRKAAEYSLDKVWAAKNFLNAAWQYHQLHRFEDALSACQSALALTPEYPLAHADTALALAGLGRKDEARKEFEEALSLKPDAQTKQYIEEGMKSVR